MASVVAIARAVFVSGALLVFGARAFAQEAPAPTAPTPAPAPSVDDPLLAPPPEAPRVLRSWDEALKMVRAQSPDYLSSYDSALRAEAQTRVALAAILPTAVAQGTFTHQLITQNLALAPGAPPTPYPPQDVWGLTGTLNWSVVDPRAYHAIGTAKRTVAAFQADLADKRRTIAQAVVSAMLGTLAAGRVAELNRVGLRASLERLALAQAKTHFGGGTELDIDRASQDVAAARALVISGDEALRQSRESLGVALGSRVAIAAPGNLDLDRFEQTVASTCRMNDDLEQRADVVAARRRVDLAERAIDDVWLQLAPTFGLGSQLLWTSEPLYGPEATLAIEGLVTVPIWDGGARYVGSSRVDLQACKLEYSIVSPK